MYVMISSVSNPSVSFIYGSTIDIWKVLSAKKRFLRGRYSGRGRSIFAILAGAIFAEGAILAEGGIVGRPVF